MRPGDIKSSGFIPAHAGHPSPGARRLIPAHAGQPYVIPQEQKQTRRFIPPPTHAEGGWW